MVRSTGSTKPPWRNLLWTFRRSSTRFAPTWKQVDREFGRHVQSQVDLIPTIGKYIQTSGGKRMRPAVLLMAARLSGYTGDRAILYAAVVEFIHTATLVHDDIIDDSDLRRGRLAVHSRWGNDITVLLGDYLYIKSMALALTHDTLDIVRLLVRRHAADDRRRAVPADQERRRRHHRRRALRHHPPQDGLSVRRLRRDRRHARQGRRRSASRRCASTASAWASRFSWSTICSTSPATPKRSASRSAATCAKAR